MSNINTNKPFQPLSAVPAGKPAETRSVNPPAAPSGKPVESIDSVLMSPTPPVGTAKQELSFGDNLGKSVKSIGGKLAGKAIEESLHVGLRVGVQYTSNRLAQRAVTTAAQEAVVGTSTKLVGMGSAKASNRLIAAVPYVAATVAAGFAVMDVKNAIEVSKDQNVSGASKALAWATVGLDAVSVATTAANKYEVIGWTAIGLSIGTSILSEVLK